MTVQKFGGMVRRSKTQWDRYLMWIWNRLLCAVGRHSADRGQARHDRDYWWSSCKVCGAQLMRDPVDGWRPPTASEIADHEAQVGHGNSSRELVAAPE